jgi:hypothetical protein
MKKFSLALLALAAVLAIAPVQSVWAGTIPVVNGNFATLPNGGLPDSYGGTIYSSYTSPGTGNIPGWTASGATGSGYGQWDPTSTYFYGYSATPTTTIGYSNGATLSQNVATVVAGDIYTLTVDIGARSDSTYNPFDGGADLLVNGIQYDATGTTPNPGYFSLYTATFTGTAATAGDPILIQLTSTGAEGDFANVQVTAIPEPGSLLLLGTGLLGLAFLAFRRATASGLVLHS